MNATQFLDLIQRADQLEKADLLQLKKVQENFPYFQIPYVLAARYDFLKSAEKRSETLGHAAITSPDRTWLRQYLERPAIEDSRFGQQDEDVPPINHEPAAELEYPTESFEKPTQQLSGQDPNGEVETIENPRPKRRQPPKEDLIETIKRKEKKKILDAKTKEQIDLIKAFSKKDIKLATIKEIEANQNTENLAESSTKLHDNLLSESFARILINQGKKGMAKEIYEKLTLKFPEKRAYFADLIEKLKE